MSEQNQPSETLQEIWKMIISLSGLGGIAAGHHYFFNSCIYGYYTQRTFCKR
jgi:hypothetical protein